MLTVALWISIAPVLADASDLVAPGRPVAIVDGTSAGTCEWPSTVAMLRDDGEGGLRLRCSGTLIHPEIVLTAAHCIGVGYEMVAVGFGEIAPPLGEAARTVAIDDCYMPDEALPEGSVNTFHNDVAFCRLAEPVEDVPIVPLISPCELDAVQPGKATVVVGYGATYATFIDNELITEGTGIKRWADMTIDFADADDWHQVTMYNLSGSTTCNGDSGGSAYLQLDDGSWRVFADITGAYTPENAPPPDPPELNCWAGSTSGYAGIYSAWLEETSGIDLTPCHDADGNWDPNDACGPLQIAPNVGAGDWTVGCGAGEVIEVAPTCEAAGTDTGGESSSSDSGGDDGADESSTASGESTGSPSGDDTTTTTTAATTSSDAESSSGGSAASGDEGGGCGCTAAPTGTGAWWLLSAFGLVRRRSRRIV